MSLFSIYEHLDMDYLTSEQHVKTECIETRGAEQTSTYSYMPLPLSYEVIETNNSDSSEVMAEDIENMETGISSISYYIDDIYPGIYIIIPFDFLLFTLSYLGLFIECRDRGILYYSLWMVTFINNLIVYWTTTQYPIQEYSLEDVLSIGGFIWRYLFIIYMTIIEINSVHSLLFQWVFTTMNGIFMYGYYKIRRHSFDRNIE